MSKNQTAKRAVSRKDMTRAQWTWKEMKRNKVAYLMIAPFMLLFIVFTQLHSAIRRKLEDNAVYLTVFFRI